MKKRTLVFIILSALLLLADSMVIQIYMSADDGSGILRLPFLLLCAAVTALILAFALLWRSTSRNIPSAGGRAETVSLILFTLIACGSVILMCFTFENFR